MCAVLKESEESPLRPKEQGLGVLEWLVRRGIREAVALRVSAIR